MCSSGVRCSGTDDISRMAELRERLEEIQPEWEAAVADAGFEIKQVRLYPFPGERSEDGAHAFYIVPGHRVSRVPNFPDDLGAQIEDANRHLNHHRVAVWVETDAPVLGAKLRHELEHARQFDDFGEKLFDLNDLMSLVISHKIGGLSGGGRLYNFKPTEVDANAAAARFAWEKYGEDEATKRLEAEDEDGAALFRSHTGPASIETLPRRLLCFLGQFPDLCELEAQRQKRTFPELLDEAWPGMGTAWQTLLQIEIE
jgi:hypothetical protein